jgi:transcriptional regulator with XRE-family HTH domain
MKNMHIDIDYDEVLKRIEKEMEGYSRTEWANKVGVRINVVSNIHGANARQNPSLKYILAVSVATQKPMDYFLWGRVSYIPSELPATKVKEDKKTYSDSYNIKDAIDSAGQDPEMGKRVRHWREDMGHSLADVSKRSGLPVDLIKSIEAGNHTSTDVIVKLADTLRCSIDFLLGCGGASVAHHPNEKRERGKR